MVQENFDDESHQSIPVFEKDSLIDLSLFQTPRQALFNLRFIINLVLGGVAGWIVNWVIALVMTQHTSRAALWNSIPDFNDPSTGTFITMYGNPIYLDWLLSAVGTAFLGGIIGHFTIRFEVSRAVKRPIHPSYTQNWFFIATGVHSPYIIVRALIYTGWGVVVSWPLVLIIFAISCSAGGMDVFLRPFDFQEEVCYLSRMWFCLNKGFFCVFVTTLIAPLIEVGCLSEPNLSRNTINRFLAKRTAQSPGFDSSSPVEEHNAAIAMGEYSR